MEWSTKLEIFKKDEVIKSNFITNYGFMYKIFIALYKFYSRSFKVNCVFMQENLPSHLS